MLSYRIPKHKERTKPAHIPVNVPPSTRRQILEDQLKRCIFKVGDRVKFKKPRRNPVYGEITAIDDDVDNVTFSSGGVPMNIHVKIPLRDKANGLQYGYQIVRTNMKKLMWEGRS